MIEIPKSNIPEVQRRIDRAIEIMKDQTDDEIFWIRLQDAFRAEAKERINSVDFKAKS